jgi:STE24 endopeptidase
MRFAEEGSTIASDTPEARRYNRIRRWLEISDFALGFVFLAALLFAGWTGVLRDWAYWASFQNYQLSVFVYVFLLMLAGKLLGFGLDYYGLRLERRYNLSNQKTRAWFWDEIKGFLVALVFGGIIAELLYFTIRQSPEHWWIIAWAMFLVLFVVIAQLAPLILFPIFYKFEPLENEDLKRRLVRLSETAGTRVRGIYKWNLSEKSKKANAARQLLTRRD